MLDEHTMLMYGGYSHECGDFCDDLWSFDLRTNQWMEMIQTSGRGGSTKTTMDSIAGTGTDSPLSISSGPGKRWRLTMLEILHPASGESAVIIFGGHRMWKKQIQGRRVG